MPEETRHSIGEMIRMYKDMAYRRWQTGGAVGTFRIEDHLTPPEWEYYNTLKEGRCK